MNSTKGKRNDRAKVVLAASLVLLVIFSAPPLLLAVDSLQVHWSAYIGGSDGINTGGGVWNFADVINEMASDASGNFYVAGNSKTYNLPNKTNENRSDAKCAFVSKLDASGNILWSTYVGGSGTGKVSDAFGIAIDPAGGYVYITGYSSADDLPGNLDAGWANRGGVFVSQIAAATGAVQWTRFLTNDSWQAQGQALYVKNGSVYVTGTSRNYQLLGAQNAFHGGDYDAFIAKLSAGGSVLKSAWYGGSESDGGNDIFVDDRENIYVTGNIFWFYVGNYTNPDYDLPNERNKWRGGQGDGFVCKLNSDFEVQWSRYIGGGANDGCANIIGDNKGNLWVSGNACSSDMEGEIIGVFDGWNNGKLVGDGYLTKIDDSGENVAWASYLGRNNSIIQNLILIPNRKIMAVSWNGYLVRFDADMGYLEWYFHAENFIPHNSGGVAFHGLFVDDAMNITIAGKATPEASTCPNAKNAHSGKGYDGLVIKTSPKEYFFNFEDGHAPGWQPNTPQCWDVSDGKYVFTGIAGGRSRASYFNVGFNDFNFEADVSRMLDGANVCGLRVRDDGNGNYYRFAITKQGFFNILKYTHNQIEIVVNWTYSSAIRTNLNDWNTLKVSAKDSVLTFYVNGKLLHREESVPYLYGRVGLFAYDYDDVEKVAFDNVYIGSYTSTQTAVHTDEPPALPARFRLYQNYPNPFNPGTTISFDVARSTHVELKVFDSSGREVATLADRKFEPGRHEVSFDASRLHSGLYICRVRAGNLQQTFKMLLVR